LYKKDRPERKGGRELKNQYVIDSVAFGLPLFYDNKLPTIKSGITTAQKHRNINFTMLSHRTYWAFETQPVFLTSQPYFIPNRPFFQQTM